MTANLSFQDLGLSQTLLNSIEQLGFERPSDIQAATIPLALQGGDLVGLSQTGSGKTAAFALPALSGIEIDRAEVQVLVLCPTRELAVQVCEETHRLGSCLEGLKAIPVYGGAPIDRQIRQLKKGVHMVVGTPGRLLDHLRRKSFNPSTIQLVILDEADRMLDMGFREEMEELLSQLPTQRQILFFSATMNKGVSRLIDRFGKDIQTVKIERKSLTVESIAQEYYEVRNRSKVEVLTRILDVERPQLSIVFGNTKRVVDDIVEALQKRGYTVDRLHGDIAQATRERTLKRFREGHLDLLVATDVAARGIDVDDVDLVVNFDLPQDQEDYVHRIGRTGRAGKTGKAVSFVYGRDIYRLQSIERYIKQSIPLARIPSIEQVEGRMSDQLFDLLRDRLEEQSGAVFLSKDGESQSTTPQYQEQLNRLLEQGHSSTDIANALLELLYQASFTRQTERIAEDHPDFLTESEKKKQGIGKKRDRKEREARREKKNNTQSSFRKGSEGERSEGKGSEEMISLHLDIGKTQGVAPGDLVGMFYNEGGVPSGRLGNIKLFSKYAIVDVPRDCANDVIKATQRSKIRGRAFHLDYAENVAHSDGQSEGSSRKRKENHRSKPSFESIKGRKKDKRDRFSREGGDPRKQRKGKGGKGLEGGKRLQELQEEGRPKVRRSKKNKFSDNPFIKAKQKRKRS